MQATTVGLDLGKDVFQVHGIASDGSVVFNRSVRRRQLLKFFEALTSCLIGNHCLRCDQPHLSGPI